MTLAITEPLQAKYHAYDTKDVIHAIGPDFRIRKRTRYEALADLTLVYKRALTEYGATMIRLDVQKSLRLLPLSGGSFAGPFRGQLADLTAEALEQGFMELSPVHQQSILNAPSLELCIFSDSELKHYEKAFAQRKELHDTERSEAGLRAAKERRTEGEGGQLLSCGHATNDLREICQT